MCLPSNVKAASIQRIATVVGIMLCANFGLMFGITPFHMQLYQRWDTPLNRPIDAEAASWVSGYLFLSFAVGASTFGFVSQKIGPKSVLLLNGLLQITAWFCMHFAYDIAHIYASRIFGGVSSGAAFVVLPIFISEICQDTNCASLMVLIDQARSLGIFLGLVLGHLPYAQVSIVGICFSFLFTMVFPFVQESPYYYMRKGNVSSMEKSLRWFRGIRQLEHREEPVYVRELQAFKAQMQHVSVAVCNMSRTYITKLFLFSLLLALGAQLSGVFVILNYAEDIFAHSVTVYPLEVNLLILAAVQFVGTTVTAWIGEHINRKILLFITSLICGLSLISMALFTSFGHQWHLNPMYTPWLPLVFLSLHMLSANMGMYPLATLVLREILPEKLYPAISSVVVGISWLLLFLCIEYFHTMSTLIGLSGCFWFFAGVCICTALFALFLLPETRGRSLEYVQHDMGYVANGSVAKIAIIGDGQIPHNYI